MYSTLGSKSNQGRKPKNQGFLDELQLFSLQHFIPTFNKYERISLFKRTQAYDLAATQMLTTYKNNVFMNFFKRLLTTLKICFPGDTTLKTTERFVLHKKYITCLCSDMDIPEILPEELILFQDFHSEFITYIQPHHGKPLHYNIKAQAENYQPLLIWLAHKLECAGGRPFQPLPLRTTCIPQHLLLDTKCMIDLLGRMGSPVMLIPLRVTRINSGIHILMFMRTRSSVSRAMSLAEPCKLMALMSPYSLPNLHLKQNLNQRSNKEYSRNST